MRRGQRDVDFTAFATDAEPRLLGTALLLTGDRRAAEDLLVHALAATRRRWRHVATSAEALTEARRALVAQAPAHTGPGDAVIVPVGADDDLSEADRVWLRALADLAPRPRAVVALRLLERLDDSAVAEVLGCSPADVADALTEAVAALGPLLAVEPEPAARHTSAEHPAEHPGEHPREDAQPVDQHAHRDGDPDAVYRRPTASGPPQPRPVPVPPPSPAPVLPPSSDDDPDAIYRRPA
ncbi:hypothetical protein [Modestobacter sp. SYSU DS0290]